jgi:cell division GTPase FtsZ
MEISNPISNSRAATDVRHRINAPNSAPRSIKLVGIGEGGTKMAARVAQQRLRNVEVVTLAGGALPSVASRSDSPETSSGLSSSGVLQAIAAENNDIAKALQGANMVFLIASSGDDVSFAPVIRGIVRRMGVLVTGIMIQKGAAHGAAAEPGLDILRAASDMLVISSDESYVTEMLGALGPP